ncbi:MAG TPA: hypothetical protein VGG07_05095 [Solirubrobacteraceae bacterium]|jgi:hypothetical protein
MWEDLQSRLDEHVTVVGTAQNAAAGAIVSLDGRPVYVSELEQWPPELVGRNVEVSGVLVFYPAPQAEGRTIHKLSDSYGLKDASWSVTG